MRKVFIFTLCVIGIVCTSCSRDKLLAKSYLKKHVEFSAFVEACNITKVEEEKFPPFSLYDTLYHIGYVDCTSEGKWSNPRVHRVEVDSIQIWRTDYPEIKVYRMEYTEVNSLGTITHKNTSVLVCDHIASDWNALRHRYEDKKVCDRTEPFHRTYVPTIDFDRYAYYKVGSWENKYKFGNCKY